MPLLGHLLPRTPGPVPSAVGANLSWDCLDHKGLLSKVCLCQRGGRGETEGTGREGLPGSVLGSRSSVPICHPSLCPDLLLAKWGWWRQLPQGPSVPGSLPPHPMPSPCHSKRQRECCGPMVLQAWGSRTQCRGMAWQRASAGQPPRNGCTARHDPGQGHQEVPRDLPKGTQSLLLTPASPRSLPITPRLGLCCSC